MTDRTPLDDVESTIGRALRQEAARADVRPDWDDVRRRAGAAPSGQRALLAVAAGVAILLAALAVPRVLGGAEDSVGLQVNPAVDLPEVTAPATPPEPADDGTPAITTPQPTATENGTANASLGVHSVGPRTIPAGQPLSPSSLLAVVSREGPDGTVHDLVVMDADGAILRTLVGGLHTAEGGIFTLSLSPDQRTVLYGVGTSACEGRVEAWATDGSSPRVTDLGPGNSAALSPDSSLMAIDNGSACGAPAWIDIAPVAGGQAVRYGDGGRPLDGWPLTDGTESSGIGERAFLDNSTLLYTIHGAARSTLHVLDLATGTSRQIDPLGDGGDYPSVAAAGQGQVGVVHTCCGPSPDAWSLAAVTPDEVLEHQQPQSTAIAGGVLSGTLGPILLSPDGRLSIAGEQVAVNVGLVAAGRGEPEVPGDGTPALTDSQRRLATEAVMAFLDELAGGEMAAAAARWDGYPVTSGEAGVVAELDRIRRQDDWPALRPDAVRPTIAVGPSWSFTAPSPVVTLLYGSARPEALAFLVAAEADSERARLIRIPQRDRQPTTPAAGSTISPGATIVVDGLPLEGGAMAFISGPDVDTQTVAVDVDHDAVQMRVTVPDDIVGPIALTISAATPEFPTAGAYAFTVR